MTRMTSVSIEERRLKQLKQQLFGKEQPLLTKAPKPNSQNTNNFQTTKVAENLKQPASQISLIDPVNVKKDLIKIITFSTFALGIQLVLFFAFRQGLINLFR